MLSSTPFLFLQLKQSTFQVISLQLISPFLQNPVWTQRMLSETVNFYEAYQQIITLHMSSVQQDRNHCFSRSEVAGLDLASWLPIQWGLAGWGCSHPPWLSKETAVTHPGLEERNSNVPASNVFKIKEQRQIPYFFWADFNGVSLFIPFPEIISSLMFSVKRESAGCGQFPGVFVHHQENKILGREYLESMTLLLSLEKYLFIWLGQGIFFKDMHNIFSASW